MPSTVPFTEPGPWSPWRHWRRWMLLAIATGLASCGSTPPPPQAPPLSPAELALHGGAVRDWAAYRVRAAQRITAANAGLTYDGVPPEPLLAIPVLEISLDAQGRVTRIEVLRAPRQALDTIELAKAAVLRAGPLGSPDGLPGPRQFVETFLFADDRRFKLRTLHELSMR